jgi:nicotinamide-nucleotide amidase
MFSLEQLRLARDVLERCRQQRLALATAESCTGGLVAACLTAIPGSSAVFTTGFVTYSNDAKTAQLGVDAAVVAKEGAVSEAVARAMAEGAVARSGAHLAVGITGVSGPGGGGPGRPVGLVHMAAARAGRPTLHQQSVFSGDRHAVRMQTVEAALALVSRQLD